MGGCDSRTCACTVCHRCGATQRSSAAAWTIRTRDQWLNRGLRLDPHATPLHEPLITLLSVTGRRAEATAVYHQCTRVFGKELERPNPQALQYLYRMHSSKSAYRYC